MHEPTIMFSGNLAAKPQLRPVETGAGPSVVANLRVAVTPRRRARDSDDWVDGETMWFSVSVWRTAAANSVSSLNQGDRVVVKGRLAQRTWRDADGVERPSFDVDAEEVALDISRYPAMSLRRPPGQRQGEQPASGAAAGDQSAAPEAGAGDDRWASTGRVDDETGEVLVAPADELLEGVAAPA